MTAPRGAPYWLQVGGKWTQLEGVAPGVEVSPDRPTSFFKTLGNNVYARVSQVAKRTWGFSFEWEDVEASRVLDYAAANPLVDAFLFDMNLAQVNMLPASLTKGSSSTSISVDGVSMPAFAASTVLVISVRPAQIYHLSYTTTATAGATIGTYVIAGGASGSVVAPSGSGVRRGSISFTSVGATITVTWTAANVTTAARFTEGSVDELGFMESLGSTPCRVLVGDGSTTYKMAWSDRLALSDSSYVLTEVG